MKRSGLLLTATLLMATGALLKMILPWKNYTIVNAEGQTNLESKEI